jgi:hypothetical protein
MEGFEMPKQDNALIPPPSKQEFDSILACAPLPQTGHANLVRITQTFGQAKKNYFLSPGIWMTSTIRSSL